MKQWIQKLVQQLDGGLRLAGSACTSAPLEMTDDRATLLYIMDIYSKHLVELDNHPIRDTRETMDDFAKELINGDDELKHEKVLFRMRQFFSKYRVSEYTYVRTTFDEFKGLLWDMVDQLAEDFNDQAFAENGVAPVDEVKEAVEADSIDDLKSKAREFIDSYVEFQARREARRAKRMTGIQKNLNVVKAQLEEANKGMQEDHLTGAYNRRSFDDKLEQQCELTKVSSSPTTLITLDIDFFKRVNDSYGHDTGDFVIKECVRMLKQTFTRESDFVARIGGEEFAVVLPECSLEHATQKAEECLKQIRNTVFMHGELQLKFTISMGIAQLAVGEGPAPWLKRADEALYASKHGGRDRYTIAGRSPMIEEVA